MSREKPGPGAFGLSLVLALNATGFAGAAWSQAPAAGRAESLGAWSRIATVLQHPRCLNCHQADVPLQGDASRPHVPRVVRGPDGHGVSAMRCTNCHNEMGNNPTAATPGAAHWQLAPASMGWQGLTSGQLCRALKDRRRNGNRSAEDIIRHVGSDALVLWAWNPGPGREPVPMPHAEFTRHLRTWAAGGAACPD
jgi:hypothetical protein